MARISVKEGQRIQESAAWAERGKNHAWWHTYGKRIVPPLAGGAALAGLAGWALYTIVTGVAAVTHGVPAWAWLALAGLIAVTLAASRSMKVRVLLGVPLALGWIALIGYAAHLLA